MHTSPLTGAQIGRGGSCAGCIRRANSTDAFCSLGRRKLPKQRMVSLMGGPLSSWQKQLQKVSSNCVHRGGQSLGRKTQTLEYIQSPGYTQVPETVTKEGTSQSPQTHHSWIILFIQGDSHILPQLHQPHSRGSWSAGIREVQQTDGRDSQARPKLQVPSTRFQTWHLGEQIF